MLNRTILLSGFILSSVICFSQSSLDRLMTERVPDCQDIALNCNKLIMKYYERQDYDSTNLILDYWYSKCGMTEAINRTMILFAIKDKNFTEAIYDSTIIYYIINYTNIIKYRKPKSTYGYYYGIVRSFGAYDNFTKELALKLIPLQKPNSIELYFCRLYANQLDNPFQEIQTTGKYDDSALKHYYYEEVNRYIKMSELHASILTGIWIPSGNAKILGNHPVLGFQGGFKYKKMTFNLTMAARLLRSKNNYQILYQGNIDTTDYYSAGYIGLDMERNILRISRIQVDILGGIAYDAIETVNTSKNNNNNNNNDNIDPHSLKTLNLNIGLGYKYFIRSNSYLAVQGKYNIVNYKNKGGTDLSGNCITVYLLYGGFLNNYKSSNLKALHYKD